MIFMSIEFVDHNLNKTFLETLLVEKSWDFYLVVAGIRSLSSYSLFVLTAGTALATPN